MAWGTIAEIVSRVRRPSINPGISACLPIIASYNSLSNTLHCSLRGILGEVDVPDEFDVDSFVKCKHVEERLARYEMMSTTHGESDVHAALSPGSRTDKSFPTVKVSSSFASNFAIVRD